MIDFPKDVKEKLGIKDVPKESHGNQQKPQPWKGRNKDSAKHSINSPKIVFRKDGYLRKDLLTSEAEKWADLLSDDENGVTATQLRNFFNEVKSLQSRIEAGGFSSNEAMVGLLKSKVAYAHARAEKKRKTGFEYLQSMIEQGVDLSKSKEDFDDFALFFEAVMGFFKGR